MKACILRSPALVASNTLEFAEPPKLAPAAGEVLIRVSVCGVCRTDLHVIEGEPPPRHMSLIPQLDYDWFYEERVIRSVANNTRHDGEDFLRLAAEIPVRSRVTLYPLREANRALNDLKADRVNGSAVLECAQ
jgi:D-arabinose 1-dehydrogenase-like Zn-dependent alcohol dehydrogenase